MNKNQIPEKLDEADELLKRGDLEAALVLLTGLHERFPDEEPVLLRLAWASWDAGNRPQAISHWEKLLTYELRHKVFTGFAYDELVRIYKEEGRIDSLVALCEKAVSAHPEDVGLLTELGGAYLLARQYENACKAFSRLVTLEDDNAAFYLKLGEALLASGKPDDALSAFEKAAQIDSEDADRYWFLAAGLYAKANQFETAKRLMTKCLALASTNSLYHCSLGDMLIALGEIDAALEAYRQACLHDKPRSAGYYNRLGNALMKAELFDQAAKAFEAALTCDASTPCRHQLAAARQALKKGPDA